MRIIVHVKVRNGSFKATQRSENHLWNPSLTTMSGRAPTEKSPAIQLRQEEVFLMPGVAPDYSDNSNQSTVGWVLMSQLVFIWESSLMSCFLSWVLS